ncbi:hypothetical protein [Sphingobacterium sp.]|uniref:hypothetical protein n=1 Tax=Sphingobacterium sp. TaxID=341027 RepID=UPI00289C29F4|nr:hypothetical protein [Sphingobacterium sp.]
MQLQNLINGYWEKQMQRMRMWYLLTIGWSIVSRLRSMADAVKLYGFICIFNPVGIMPENEFVNHMPSV